MTSTNGARSLSKGISNDNGALSLSKGMSEVSHG
jgi:hypothetical protein